MKGIIKLPITKTVSELLQNKQNKINSGIKNYKSWKLSSAQRKQIVNKLIKSQKAICCYCECRIDKKNSHIEHFYE
jgi:hypothetical protein